MRDQHDRALAGVAAHQLLDDVGLPGEPVDVVGRLVGEAVAEKVERQRRPIGAVQHAAPVEAAGREAVQQQQQRAVAVAAVDVDLPVAEVCELAFGEPPFGCRGQGHAVLSERS